MCAAQLTAVNQRYPQKVGLAEEVDVGWAAWPQKGCLVHIWCKSVCVCVFNDFGVSADLSDETRFI